MAEAVRVAAASGGEAPTWETFRQREDVAALIATRAAEHGRRAGLARVLSGWAAQLERGAGWAEVVAAAGPLDGGAATLVPESGATRELWERGQRLVALTTETAPAPLIDVVRAGPASERLTAWRRLVELEAWPAGVADLALVGELAGLVAGEGAAALPRIWRRVLVRAQAAGQVAAMLPWAEAWQIAEAELKLGERFALTRERLRQVPWLQLSPTELRQEHARAGAVLSDLAREGVAEATLLARALLAINWESKEIDYTAVGPARVGWTLVAAPESSGVVYRWTSPAGNEHYLEFLPLGAGEGGLIFMGATEVPVGLALEWWAAKLGWAKWQETMETTLGDMAYPRDDRRGPRSYGQVSPGVGDGWPMEVARDWLQRGVPPTYYASPVEPPSAATPLNYISTQAAQRLARSLEMALPTIEEWKRALEAERGQASVSANLRDRTWGRQHEHVGAAPLGDKLWPDADVFPPLMAAKGIKEGQAATVATPGVDDGVLWFAPVPLRPTGRFHHVEGNVAELVTLPDASLAVIGGSALSPPELARIEPHAVDSMDVTQGFSDVGVRLVLRIDGDSNAWTIRRILLQGE